MKNVAAGSAATFAAGLFLFALAAGAQQSGMQTGKMEQQFVRKAAQGGMAEVEIGKLAQEKGNEDVKRIGKTLVQDHSKGNQKLQQIASQKGIPVPDSPGKHQAMITKLSSLSGDEFNREFLKAQAKDHQEDIEEFEKAATTMKDTDLKQFASDSLPTLRKHEQMIEMVAKKMGIQMSHMESHTNGHSHRGGHDAATADKSSQRP